MDKKAASKGGRPATPWHERARVRFWYGALRKRIVDERADYQLDKQFVWEKSSVGPLRLADGVRLFEGIRRDGAVTGNLVHVARMTLAEVINYVDADPRFAGTKDFYEASFWDRLAEHDLSVIDAERQMTDLLLRHRIARVATLPARFQTMHPCLGPGTNHELHYRWLLGLTLSELKPLQVPGFLWSLRRLCFHRKNSMMLEEIETRMDLLV